MLPQDNVTELLAAWSHGDREAGERLMPLVHDELKRIARRHLQHERRDHTLQPTALVNEAFLRLVGQEVRWQNRAHFFGLSAELMRRILVDYARARATDKRGGGWVRITLEEAADVPGPEVDLVAIDDALLGLAILDPRQARVVELRFFGGLTIEETAEVLGLSPATIKREWSLAKAWLRRELAKRKI